MPVKNCLKRYSSTKESRQDTVTLVLCKEKLCGAHCVPYIPLRAVLLPGLPRVFRDGRTGYSGANVHEHTDFHEHSCWFPFLQTFLEMHCYAYSCVQKQQKEQGPSNFLTLSESLDYFRSTHSSLLSVCVDVALYTYNPSTSWLTFHKGPQVNQQNRLLRVSLNPGFKAQGSSLLKIPDVLRANVAFGNGVNYYLLLQRETWLHKYVQNYAAKVFAGSL